VLGESHWKLVVAECLPLTVSSSIGTVAKVVRVKLSGVRVRVGVGISQTNRHVNCQ
jgi:hypothetical protein